MSGIYIPGMEMPKSCYDCYLRKRIGLNIVCPISNEEFAVADVNILYYRLDNCPLVPVPEHGRLIDADDFLELCNVYAITPSDDEFCKRLEYALTRAATIIPAEEGE